jgi:hypothetical protein
VTEKKKQISPGSRSKISLSVTKMKKLAWFRSEMSLSVTKMKKSAWHSQQNLTLSDQNEKTRLALAAKSHSQ